MKKLIRIMLPLMAIFALTCSVSAQPRKTGEKISREQLAEKQAKHISEKLCFSPEVSEKFIETYLKCQHEIWEMGPSPRKGRAKKGSMTDTQTDSIIQSRFDHSQKLLDLRKKYYAEYSKFLTPKQIDRVYEMERQMKQRLSDRKHSRKNSNTKGLPRQKK